MGFGRPAACVGRLALRAGAATLAALVAALAPQPAAAAPITWGPATTISGDTDVAASGIPLYAYAGGGTTVNGVAFTQVGSGSSWGGGNVTLGSVSSGGFAGSFYSAFTGAAAPFSNLPGDYQAAIAGGAYGGASAGLVTLNGLTVGQDYVVQIWVNDSRTAGEGRFETVTSSGGNSVTLNYNSTTAVGGVGQYTTGFFTANSTSQTFTLTPGETNTTASVQLNAINVLGVGTGGGGPARAWLGSTNNSWGTAGNWSPADNVLPGDAVTFNNLSTANLATVLDVNYSVASLTLSNAPSAVSIGLANDGNILTINSGITLVGASPSQSLTIGDAVGLNASQIWTVTNNGTLTIDSASPGVSDNGAGYALTLTGGGTVSLQAPATYTGNTTLSGGNLTVGSAGSIASPTISIGANSLLSNAGSLAATNVNLASGGYLALSGSGTFSASPLPTINLAGGATFDVSGESSSPFYLNNGTLVSGAAGAVINGTIDCTSATLWMPYYDGANAPFIQTNGSMTLSSGTVVIINNTGPTLGLGNHVIVTAATAGHAGAVTCNSFPNFPNVTLEGNGAVGAYYLTNDADNDLVLFVSGSGVDVWTGNADSAWEDANWNPGSVPQTGDYVLFNSSSVNNLSTVIGANYSLEGLSVLNPSGPVGIAATAGSALGISSGGINMASANQNLAITAPLDVTANQTWVVTNGQTLIIGGSVSASAEITMAGGGTVQMGASGVLNGLTSAGSNSGDITNNGTLDLHGTAQIINGLDGNGVVDSKTGSTATLTVGGNGDSSSFNGILQNTSGALQLQVAGGGLALNSPHNTYSGGTIFNQGSTLSFPSATATLGTGPVVFNPGSATYTYGCAFTNPVTLDSCYFEVGGNNDNQIWSGPATVINGFQMSGDNGNCQLYLSGPINIGTGGVTITNFGNSGPQGGSGSGLGDVLSGPISGSGGITYFLSGGNSRLTVQGTNTYAGGTIVNGDPNNPGGKLNVWGGNYAFSTGPVTLNSNALLEAYPGAAMITNALTLNGGQLESESQYNNYNQLTWAGPITLTANSTLFCEGANNSQQSAGVVVTGPLNINGYTLNCSGTANIYEGNFLFGPISGTGLIEGTANGLTISGTNTFSGTVEPVAGGLSVGNALALQYATLDLDPADSGSVSWASGVTSVQIGALIGSRNLTLASGTTTLGANNATAEYDGALTGGNLVKAGSGTVTLTGANTFNGFITVNGGTLALTGATSYGGNTTVNAGMLSLSQPNLTYSSTVTVTNGAVLNLNFTGVNVVTALVLNGVTQPRGVYSSTNASPYLTGTGVIQVGATPEIWTGLTGNGDWSTNNEGSPYNWTFNGHTTNYTDGSAVQFDDSAAAANTTVNINDANVMPTAVIFSNTVNNYTLSGSFGIVGGAALYKSGTNQVTLDTPNSFLGSMTLSGGTLTIGSGGSLATNYGGAISFTNGATLEYSTTTAATLSGNITGPGSLLFDSTSANILTLSGVNTYSGTTTIGNVNNTGIRLSVGANSISPNTTFNIVGTNTSGGQLYITSAGTVSNNITMSGLGYDDHNNYDGALLLANGVTLSGTLTTVAFGSTNLTQVEVLNQNAGATPYTNFITGQITGSGGVNFYGLYGSLTGSDSASTNIIFLANTNSATPNNYAGNTEIYNQYTSSAGSGGPNNTILKLGANEQIPNGPGYGILLLGGWNSANANRSCTFELNGFNETVNGINTPVAGPSDNFIQNTATGASTLTVGDANTSSTYSGTIKDGGAGKTLALTKIGTGTLTLNGANTYIGNTTISGGTLLIGGTAPLGGGTYPGNLINNATFNYDSSSIQNLAGGVSGSGAWIVSAGKLVVPSTATANGVVTNNAALGVIASGTSQWTPASLTLANSCTLEFNSVQNVGTTLAPLAPASAIGTVSSVTININSFAAAPVPATGYPLLGNANTTTGYKLGTQPFGLVGHLALGSDNATLVYVVDAQVDTWAGTDPTNPTWWDIGISHNWAGNAVNNTPQNTYAQNDYVAFTDAASTNTVLVQTLVTPSTVIFSNSVLSYTVIGTNNVIGGSGGLSKSGTASVVLAGGAHSYSGATVINSGTLQLGNGSSGNDATLAGTSGLTDNGALVYNTFGSNTASYAISGTGTLTKQGPGTNVLTGVLTYSGATTVSKGELDSGNWGATTSGGITVGNTGGATGTLGVFGGTLALGANSMTVSSSSTGMVNQTGGTVSFTSGNALLVGNGTGGNGTYNLSGGTLTSFASATRGVIIGVNNGCLGTFNLTGSGNLSLGSAELAVGRDDSAITNCTVAYNQSGGTATVDYLSIGGQSGDTTTSASFTVTNGTFTAASFQHLVAAASSSATLYLGGGAQVTLPAFPAKAGTANITFDFTGGHLSPYAASAGYMPAGTFNNAYLTTNGLNLSVASGNNIMVGQLLANAPSQAGTLTKSGPGTLTLTNANTYSGGTRVSAGTLLVTNGVGSGTGTGAVNINNGGALGGTGTIAGAVTNNAGGILAPGVSGSGTLTLNNYLTLVSGSTNTFAVNGTTPANTKVALAATASVTYGGVLNIATNGTFTLGQTFTLFSGAGATNASNFASIAGSPGAGLVFSFTNGVLSVGSLVLPKPVINTVTASGGNLILQGTNGASSGTYSVLTATNLALPLASWTTNSTGMFTPGGTFSNAIPVATQGQRFFLIKQP